MKWITVSRKMGVHGSDIARRVASTGPRCSWPMACCPLVQTSSASSWFAPRRLLLRQDPRGGEGGCPEPLWAGGGGELKANIRRPRCQSAPALEIQGADVRCKRCGALFPHPTPSDHITPEGPHGRRRDRDPDPVGTRLDPPRMIRSGARTRPRGEGNPSTDMPCLTSPPCRRRQETEPS